MRILHVMEATIGGTRRHLVDVCLAQRARGHGVAACVSTLRDPGFPGDIDVMRAAGVDVREVPMVREIRPLKDLRHRRQVERILKELRPDIVHTHSSKAGVLGRRASMRTGIGARVHTPHTFAFLFSALFGRMKRTLIRSVERGLGHGTHALVAVSPSEAETIAASGVIDPGILHTVVNGIDPARIEGAPPVDLAELGLDPELPVAAVVGLVYRAKGQDLALEVLASRELHGLQLLFVGPGELDELRGQAEALGVADRIAITGPRSDVPSVLAAVDMLLLPSRWEGMPYVVLEAMAASLPVVATPVDGARDLVEDDVTGYLAGSLTASGIADALERAVLAGGGRRSDLGATGRARLLESYTVEAMAEGLDRVYASALEVASR